MTTKRWQAGLAALVAAVGLLANAMPVAGGQLATWVSYAGAVTPPVGVTPLDAIGGDVLVLNPGQYVVVEFQTPLDGTNCPGLQVRLHMDGSEPSAVWSTLIALNPAVGASWWGPLCGPNGDFIYPDLLSGLSSSWLDFPIDLVMAGFGWSNITQVKIENCNAGPITIDAVEGPSFVDPPTGPAVMIEDLAAKVVEFNLQQGINNSLDAKLEAALLALDDVHANNDAAAVNKLQAFINEVEAQRGNKIEEEQADILISGIHDPANPSGDFEGAQDIIDDLLTQT